MMSVDMAAGLRNSSFYNHKTLGLVRPCRILDQNKRICVHVCVNRYGLDVWLRNLLLNHMMLDFNLTAFYLEQVSFTFVLDQTGICRQNRKWKVYKIILNTHIHTYIHLVMAKSNDKLHTIIDATDQEFEIIEFIQIKCLQNKTNI